ncbi:MAG TPA: hypothetical protein VH986_00625 [Acidimicrobiia bacterium]|jgi:hypothetical protein
MSVDERRRLELAEAAKRIFGDEAGITLMELLPPVGWADVATKQDLAVLRGDIDRLDNDFQQLRAEFGELRNEFKDLRRDFDVRLDQGFRQMLVTLSSLVIAGFLVGTFALVAATLVR